MTAAHVSDRLADHLEGDLSLAERTRVDRHLAECEACAAELRELRSTVALLRGLPDPEPPVRLRGEIMRRIEAGEGARPRAVHLFARLGQPRFAAALAAGIAAIAVATTFDFGMGDFLGTSSDRSPERLASPGASGVSAVARATRANRPLSLRRASAEPESYSPRRMRSALVAMASPVPPRRATSFAPVAGFRVVGGSVAEAPLRDLDGELEGLMNDPAAFLDRMRRTAASARRPMIAPLIEHSARRGDAAAVARHLGTAARPVVVPASAR